MAADAKAATAPKRSGMGGEVINSESGSPILRIDGRKRKELSLTLLLTGGGNRADAEKALHGLLDAHWPQTA